MEGKTLATAIKEKLPARAREVASALGRAPRLVGISWQGDYAGHLYLNKEAAAARKAGIRADIVLVDESTSEKDFKTLLSKIYEDDSVDALLIPRPLPPALNGLDISVLINPKQDIDGAGLISMGRLFMCKTWADVEALNTFVPCCPLAVMRLLEYHGVNLRGAKTAVIGRSNTVGGPLAKMLMCKDATVTVCHTKTADLKDVIYNQDIVISAAGRARFIKKDMVKKGTILIDVGTNQDEAGVFCGDIDFENIKQSCAVSPVPGGVGPVTVACLLENILSAAERKSK